MFRFTHPDVYVDTLLVSNELNDSMKSRVENINKVCKARFNRGERSFQPAEMARELAAAGVMPISSYMNSPKLPYLKVGEAWQSFSDTVDLDLQLDAPSGHPDAVLVELLIDPKRRGNSAKALRLLHKICKDRFNRGEMNFSQAAVERDLASRGMSAQKRYTQGKKLLLAWERLADERAALGIENSDESEPNSVFEKSLRERSVKSSTANQLNQLQEVCQLRFDQGEFDFSAQAMADVLREAGVFRRAIGLNTYLHSNKRWSSILHSWQQKADARWIDSDPDLSPMNPHAVFRRLRGKKQRADKLRQLLVLHRICFLEQAAGNKDFSLLKLGKLLSARGILTEKSIYRSACDDLRALASAWDDYARPWLALDGPPSPTIDSPRRKSHDIDLEWVRRDYPELEEWRELASEWLQTIVSGLSHRINAIILFIGRYLTKDNVPKTPAEFLRRGMVLPDILTVIGKSSSTKRSVSLINDLYDFFEWVLLRSFTVEADDGELVVSPAFRNPLARAVAPRGMDGPSQSVRSPLPYGYVQRLRRILASGMNFSDWGFAQHALGSVNGLGRPGSDWYEVDRSLIDEDDPDCVWQVRTLSNGRVIYQMWSPVRWVCLLTKLSIPLRTGQARMLDSGESDTYKYQAGKWVVNEHPLAVDNKRELWQQGVFRRSVDPANRESISTLLYINTNKTADMNKDGPHKGYTTPWFSAPDPQDDIFYWLGKLRDWQEKYNPIGRRTEWSELTDKHIGVKSDEQLASYLPTCFLFRLPEEKAGLRHLPLTDGIVSNAWANLLEHFQSELAAKGETHPGGEPIVFVTRNKKGQIQNDFPLHSLRVSLITAFALDGGVPFAILQKLVGHARLLMTLYYTKPGQARFTRLLSEAAEKMEVNKEESIHTFLLNTEYDAILKHAISNNSSGLAAAIPTRSSDRNPAGWMHLHHGICLVGGNVSEIEGNKAIGGCYNGGPPIGSKGSSINGPVPGGSRNCVRCRWFVTEPHHLAALAAQFNTVAYHFDEARNRAIDAERTYQTCLREKAEQEYNGSVFTEQKRLLQAERIMESTMREFSDYAEDLVATWRLIERCKEALNSESAGGLQLVIQGEASEVKAIFEETESELLQLCGVCESIELYPDLEADKAILRRSQLLDSALYNEGLPPMFLKLSQEEQLKVGNALMRSLSRHAAHDSPFIGQRKVVELIDAGEKLGQSLGINLIAAISELKMSSGKSLQLELESEEA